MIHVQFSYRVINEAIKLQIIKLLGYVNMRSWDFFPSLIYFLLLNAMKSNVISIFEKHLSLVSCDITLRE